MKHLYQCDYCYGEFHDCKECADHESSCNENPASRSCETCGYHDTVVAGTGKVWNVCEVGLLKSPLLRENHATNCPKWRYYGDDGKEDIKTQDM